MEITERVVKEQEQRKEQERIWESRYELRYGEESSPDGSAAKEKIQELARTYGEKSYTSREELLSSPMFNLVARTIYGEQTGASVLDDNEERREKDKAQDAVTWVIINRVLGQNSVHTQGREVTLRSVVTTEKQFTTLENEQGNNQSYIAKSDYEWPGWEHAVENAYWVAEILGNIDGNSTQRELDEARKKLEERIGVSEIGQGEFYRSSVYFEENLVKKDGMLYLENIRIKNDYIVNGDNTYFNYY